MSEKFIVNYIDYSHGKETNLSEEFSFEYGADQDAIKNKIWKWKRDNGYKITRFQRYSSRENSTFDAHLGGEI